MPVIKAKAQEEIASKPELPVPATSFEFDEATNELVVTARFSFDYDDAAIIERLGRVPKDEKGNPTGEPKPVTSRTYGVLKSAFVGAADADDNPLLVSMKLFANTKEAEAEATSATDETE